MMKMSWREVAVFVTVLICATGALVAAGLTEGSSGQQPTASHVVGQPAP